MFPDSNTPMLQYRDAKKKKTPGKALISKTVTDETCSSFLKKRLLY